MSVHLSTERGGTVLKDVQVERYVCRDTNGKVDLEGHVGSKGDGVVLVLHVPAIGKGSATGDHLAWGVYDPAIASVAWRETRWISVWAKVITRETLTGGAERRRAPAAASLCNASVALGAEGLVLAAVTIAATATTSAVAFRVGAALLPGRVVDVDWQASVGIRAQACAVAFACEVRAADAVDVASVERYKNAVARVGILPIADAGTIERVVRAADAHRGVCDAVHDGASVNDLRRETAHSKVVALIRAAAGRKTSGWVKADNIERAAVALVVENLSRFWLAADGASNVSVLLCAASDHGAVVHKHLVISAARAALWSSARTRDPLILWAASVVGTSNRWAAGVVGGCKVGRIRTAGRWWDRSRVAVATLGRIVVRVRVDERSGATRDWRTAEVFTCVIWEYWCQGDAMSVFAARLVYGRARGSRDRVNDAADAVVVVLCRRAAHCQVCCLRDRRDVTVRRAARSLCQVTNSTVPTNSVVGAASGAVRRVTDDVGEVRAWTADRDLRAAAVSNAIHLLVCRRAALIRHAVPAVSSDSAVWHLTEHLPWGLRGAAITRSSRNTLRASVGGVGRAAVNVCKSSNGSLQSKACVAAVRHSAGPARRRRLCVGPRPRIRAWWATNLLGGGIGVRDDASFNAATSVSCADRVCEPDLASIDLIFAAIIVAAISEQLILWATVEVVVRKRRCTSIYEVAASRGAATSIGSGNTRWGIRAWTKVHVDRQAAVVVSGLSVNASAGDRVWTTPCRARCAGGSRRASDAVPVCSNAVRWAALVVSSKPELGRAGAAIVVGRR